MEPVPRVRIVLRRYKDYQEGQCFHDAHVAIGDEDEPPCPDGLVGQANDDFPHTDPRWPKACEKCGYEFQADDYWQHNRLHLYERADTGEQFTLRMPTPPPGAMWDATWWPHKHPDGMWLMVILPNGHEWAIDGPATNCNLPDKKHQCWHRTGKPPMITVGQGECKVGAGSIANGQGAEHYHGFLRNGVFT
jgi:hypothetical protein